MVDVKLRQAVANEVRAAMQGFMEQMEERWLTGDQLVSQFGCFSKSWLKSYGHTLPRTQAVVTCKDGEHRSGWCYPMHRIQRMLMDGSIKQLIN